MANDKHGTLTAKLCDEVTIVTNPVKIQDLTFRDGHQSLFATRGRTEDFYPSPEEMDRVGFYSMEVWGGATFDTMHRFLGEDPWERIRTLKKYIKKTPFSMLLRAQNLVGYRNYADDVAVAFVDRSCENGIDIFRHFDALNDYRKTSRPWSRHQKEQQAFPGLHLLLPNRIPPGRPGLQPGILRQEGQRPRRHGADTICIKDMARLIAPYDAYILVKALKETREGPDPSAQPLHSGMPTCRC